MRTKIEVKDIRKSFATDKGRCASIDGVSFTVARRRDRRHRRPVGLRQVDADEHDRRIRPARPGRGVDRRRAARGRARKGILISQHGSVFPWLTVRENLMFGLNGHAPRRQGRARRPLRRASWG